MQKMLVVAGIDFNKHVILPGGEVAFNHFGNLLELLNHFVEMFRLLKENAHESTSVITQGGRLD